MKERLRILLIGSDDQIATLLLDELTTQQFSLQFKFVNDAEALTEVTQNAEWDLGLFDCTHASQGLMETFRHSPMPLLAVVDETEESIGLSAMAAGIVVDYVFKTRLERLGPQIRRELAAARIRRELAAAKVLIDAKTAELVQKTQGAHQAETDLKKEALRRQILMNASHDGIAIFNQDHQLVECNQRFAEMLGYDLIEMTDLHTWDFEAVMSEEEIRAGFADLTQTYAAFETRHRRKDGSIYDVEVSASGALVGDEPMVFTVSRDITEKKKLQATLAQSDRLASMGMLAAGVAHEINNPLAFVLYHLQTLSKDIPVLEQQMQQCRDELHSRLQLDAPKLGLENGLSAGFSSLDFEKINKRVREALEGTRRIQEIAGALSTFSRVERRQLTPVDVHYTIECAANMAFNEIKYRARFVKDFGEIPKVPAGEGSLSQVFLNLLINAVHAIDEGRVDENEIRVKTRQEADDVCIQVSDTGKGISPKNLERIFDPFFTTKSIGEGSGLGLTISRNIIAGYGGRIDVSSTEGEGTCFTIRIPIRPNQAGQAVIDNSTPLVSTTGGRILIIDDEVGILEALADTLDDHEVMTASSAKKGMALANSHRNFDLVLCDLMMPEMSGMSFHQWLSTAHPALAGRLVFITGGAFTPKARDYLSKVENLCIHKPFDLERLPFQVAELIAANRSKPVRG